MSLTNNNDPESPPDSPSPSSSSGDGFVEVTGVLYNSAFSATLDFAPEWSAAQVAHNLHSRLSENVKELFECVSPLGLSGVDIYKSTRIPPTDRLQTPITELQIEDNSHVKYLIMLDPPSDQMNFVETFLKKNKENLAAARADRLISEERASKEKGGKKKQKQAKTESVTSSEVHLMLQKLEENLIKQGEVIAELRTTNAEQQKTNAEQQKINAEQQKTNFELSEKVAQQAHTLHALHRRIVLDQARDILIDRYDLKMSGFRLRGCRDSVQKQKVLRSLVQSVRRRLVPDDSNSLSDDALNMIFDDGKKTIRNAGNVAAHEALLEDISLAVLDGSLTLSQSATLSSIYQFIHNEEPQLQ